MAENIAKNKEGYGYKYADLAQIHEYLGSTGQSYYQYIETDDLGTDYIMTVPIVDGKEQPVRRGCRVMQATLSGRSNPAQEQGSALTYARRYSLLMAFGLATEDDDAAACTQTPEPKAKKTTQKQQNPVQDVASKKISVAKTMALVTALEEKGIEAEYIYKLYGVKAIKNLSEKQHDHIIKNLDKLREMQDKEGKDE